MVSVPIFQEIYSGKFLSPLNLCLLRSNEYKNEQLDFKSTKALIQLFFLFHVLKARNSQWLRWGAYQEWRRGPYCCLGYLERLRLQSGLSVGKDQIKVEPTGHLSQLASKGQTSWAPAWPSQEGQGWAIKVNSPNPKSLGKALRKKNLCYYSIKIFIIKFDRGWKKNLMFLLVRILGNLNLPLRSILCWM